MCDRSHYFTSYVWQVIVSYQLCVTGHSVLPAMCDRSQYLTSYVYCLVVLDGLAPIVAIQRDSSVTLGVFLHLLLPRHIFHPVRQRRAITGDDHKHKNQTLPQPPSCLVCRESRTIKGSPFTAYTRSDYSITCFPYWQEFWLYTFWLH